MKLYELGRYNIPEKIIDAWIDRIGEELLPIQERAIKSQLLLTKARAKNLKLTLLLDRWIRGKDGPSLERDFQSYYGTIATAPEAMSQIVDAASVVAKSIGSPKPLEKTLASLKGSFTALRTGAWILPGSGSGGSAGKEAIEPKTEIKEIHGFTEKDTAYGTYACKDHMEITGRPLKKRNKVFIFIKD